MHPGLVYVTHHVHELDAHTPTRPTRTTTRRHRSCLQTRTRGHTRHDATHAHTRDTFIPNTVIGTVTNGIGTFLGDALAAPFRTLFGMSCENVCSGTWDLPCFIEHVCLLSLAKLFVVIVVTYVVLLFGYLLVKLGIVKCVAKNACKVVWKPCLSACCLALGAACCLLWAKVRDTKRVYRGRRERDVELGESGTSRDDTGSPSSSDDDGGGHRRRGGTEAGSRSRGKSLLSSVRERRKDRIRHSLRLKRVSSKLEHAVRLSHGSGRHQHRHSTESRRTEASSLSPSLERVYGSATRDNM